MDPTTGYAQIGDQRVAYSFLGDGPIDIIFTFGFWGSFDRGAHTLKGFEGQWQLFSVIQPGAAA